ncbi:MAG: methyltransferase domain-containing protein [Phycisphaerales bacterium]|jgi:hypothetical protein
MRDKTAGDVDYASVGDSYSRLRRADPRIAQRIHAALGDARTVLNVGAGAGSYEPNDRHVIAIEPSEAMRRQRPRTLAPAINARAESLPLDAQSVDASMATVTVHQWRDRDAGLAELVRVTRGPIVVMAFDPAVFGSFWLAAYAPEYVAAERARDVPMPVLTKGLSDGGRRVRISTVPVPIDCSDGFVEAYYGRPERYLDESVTRAQSGWGFTPPGTLDRFRAALGGDLASGEWDRKHRHWRTQPSFEGALRLLVSEPA